MFVLRGSIINVGVRRLSLAPTFIIEPNKKSPGFGTGTLWLDIQVYVEACPFMDPASFVE